MNNYDQSSGKKFTYHTTMGVVRGKPKSEQPFALIRNCWQLWTALEMA